MMIPETSTRSNSFLTGSTSYSNSSSEEEAVAPWKAYPFNLSTYNPLTEWGEHYQKVFNQDLWKKQSSFDLQELRGSSVTERHITGSEEVDYILSEEDPDVRIFYCDSKLCSDLVTRASFATDDVKKIFFKYNISVVFLDRFIGRNRCTTGSRKIRDPKDSAKIIAYDIWYDLPCRIFNSEREYNWHFVLFTVYVHYDVVRKKTVLFYIHRLGSEHPSSAEVSSRNVKSRIRSALEHAACQDDPLAILKSSPFIMQLPTITSCTTFWTETLHTERLSMWAKEDEGKQDISNIDILALHNVNRYVHSYIANIRIVQQTLDFVDAEHAWFAKHIGHHTTYHTSPWFETVSDCLRSQRFQVQVILTWTEEVLKRTRNLINLYFNRVSQMTSRTTGKIAEETQKDAISMRTIALVSLLFLPATFVSAVFDMPFFQDLFKEVSLVWVYFLITVVLTLSVLTMWFYWLQSRMNVIRKDNSIDFKSFI